MRRVHLSSLKFALMIRRMRERSFFSLLSFMKLKASILAFCNRRVAASVWPLTGCPSALTRVCLPAFQLSVCPDVSLSFRPTVCLSVRLHLCLPVLPTISLSFQRSDRLAVRPPICLSFLWLSFRPYVCPSFHPTIYASIRKPVLPAVCLFICICVLLSALLEFDFVRWTSIEQSVRAVRHWIFRCLLRISCFMLSELQQQQLESIINIYRDFFRLCTIFMQMKLFLLFFLALA